MNFLFLFFGIFSRDESVCVLVCCKCNIQGSFSVLCSLSCLCTTYSDSINCVCVCTHNFKVALIGVLHNTVVTCTLLLVGRRGGGIFVYSELCIHGML